jgi:LysM repeat protein
LAEELDRSKERHDFRLSVGNDRAYDTTSGGIYCAPMSRIDRVRCVGGYLAVLSLMIAVAACGDDDSSSSTSPPTESANATVAPTVESTAAPTTAPPTTEAPEEPEVEGPSEYTIVAGDSLIAIAETAGVTLDELIAANGWPDGSDHLILPGDVITLPPRTSGDGASPAPPADEEPGGGYGPQTVELTPDERTEPITTPLADGVYFSQDYSAIGDTVTFTLTQYFLCDSSTNVADEPDVDCASGFGTLDEPTAPVDLAPDAVVTVATGDLDDPTRADVTAAEFARLVAGEAPGADAPEGYEFSKFFMFVEVTDGAVVAGEQFYTS